MKEWHAQLADQPRSETASRMRSTNPKYVPREWMLVQAYEAAGKGDFSKIEELFNLFLRPYDEQPDKHAKFYRRAPKEVLTKGGTAFMS